MTEFIFNIIKYQIKYFILSNKNIIVILQIFEHSSRKGLADFNFDWLMNQTFND